MISTKIWKIKQNGSNNLMRFNLQKTNNFQIELCTCGTRYYDDKLLISIGVDNVF